MAVLKHSTNMYSVGYQIWTVFCAILLFNQVSSKSERDILIKNKIVRVPFGRSVYLDAKKHFAIDVDPGDRCTVTVLRTDALSERPGKLSPRTFPCDFQPQSVIYNHYGARNPSEDSVPLQIRYDSPTDTVIIPFTLQIDVTFTQLEVVTKNMPLVVKAPREKSRPFSSKTHQFSYNRDTELCTVSVLTGNGGKPRYGTILAHGQSVTERDCDEFLEADIRYQHTSEENSPDRDYIPMLAEVFHQDDGTKQKEEYFHTMVKIREGDYNTVPEISPDSVLVLEVDQFVMTALTPDVIKVVDRETLPKDLVVNITQPLEFGEGELVSTDDQNLLLKSFRQKDITDLKIAYKPPSFDSDVQRIFAIGLQAVDSEGRKSEPFLLTVIVNPMNTMAPLVTKNTGIQLFEGQSRPLLSSQNLRVSDENNLEDVRITVIDGLRHGDLNIMGTRMFFTPADLDAGVVRYQHDGSETFSDNIIFRMTDGQHDVEFLFPITIHPVDDEPPILNVNLGSMIEEGETAKIDQFVLSATDIDSDDPAIVFSLDKSKLLYGDIIKKQFEAPKELQGWRRVDGFYVREVNMWTQKDIMDGKIFYQHRGDDVIGMGIIDRVTFTVKDDSEPPNESNTKEFMVKIVPKDNQPPEVYLGVLLNMVVQEYQLTPFTKRLLRYTDADSEDRHLKYTITRPPYDTDENSIDNNGGGNLVLCEDPEEVVSSFTQAQVNHKKICYQPPSAELGLIPREVKFLFRVEDPSSNYIDNQEFTIALNPVDNKPPTVIHMDIMVLENGFAPIDKETLNAEDEDTEDSDIKFKVTRLPELGSLRLDGEDIQLGRSFDKSDIENGKVYYRHKGDYNGDSDSFGIEVTDGVHHVPVNMKVKIQSVDDDMPQLDLIPGELGAMIEVNEGQASPITAEHLRASDPDTADLMLTFLIDVQPMHGAILVDGQPVQQFTQKDILQEAVEYVHLRGEIGLKYQTDSFNLTLSDMSDDWVIGGNRISGVNVLVKILPVDNQVPNVTIGSNIFKVAEGNKSKFGPSDIQVTDVDSVIEDIVCTVLAQPSFGYLENISPGLGSEKPRTGLPISAFTYMDILVGNINFVQSIHKGVEPKEDSFTLKCSDGTNVSPNVIFPIIISPTNDEKPQIFAREFIVEEGHNLIIDMPILTGVDEDEPADNLVFTIIRAPLHGSIVKQEPLGTSVISKFLASDIKGISVIAYEHDDTETLKDSFRVRLSDGIHTTEEEIMIVIIPVDDETPRLSINNGLEIEVGEIVVISDEDLKATDLDSFDSNLTYTVRKTPSYGFLQKQFGKNVFNLTKGHSFTQHEIDEGHIQYHHTGREGVRDLIKFDITDGINPLIDRYFYISIEGIDREYPEVINQGVKLPEGGNILLTTNLLSTTDSNSPDENLEFTLTRPPSNGHLESTDSPGVALLTFTQLELAGNKIRYVHTSHNEVKMDSFEFEVTDGYNPVFRTFRISLSDVDNKKPVLMLEPLRIKEGGTKLITPFELRAVDSDTEDKKLEFTVSREPRHGVLRFNETEPVWRFTMRDLKENLITYEHDGTETSEDFFKITVTDGTHNDFFVFPHTTRTTRRPQKVPIHIVPVDDGFPYVSTNIGSTWLMPMEGNNLGFQFSPRDLEAEDRDSPNDKLLFTITQPPRHGYLINHEKGNVSITSWTQGDIDRRVISYILRPGSNRSEDVFSFKVTDKGGNEADEETFHLQWCWLSFSAESFTVQEKEELLVAKLNRRGFLGETVFVSVTPLDGSAVSGEDFSKRYPQQVQFNPGEVEKTWNLPITNDNSHESAEQFWLELSDPVMSALEKPKVAVVTILDEEDESVVTFSEAEYIIGEDIGELLVPITRSGDLSRELLVMCSTSEGSAKGTVPRTVTSFSDYMTRPEGHESVVHFSPGDDTKFCGVVIIDDSLDEPKEEFSLALTYPVGGHMGEHNTTHIVIMPDKEDGAKFFFGASEYGVDESEGHLEVAVWRSGTDLSRSGQVTVRSRRTKPAEAKAGLDYVAVNVALNFEPQETLKVVNVKILDDLGRPSLEWVEKFELLLRMPMNASVGQPGKTVISINDSVSDLPRMQFQTSEYVVSEDEEVVTMVTRTGDLGHIASVRCYTRQDTARVDKDYVERTDTEHSRIIFQPGEQEKECRVQLREDDIHEGPESFRLVLGSPESPTATDALLGHPNSTTITINDIGDKSIIKFSKTKFSVTEPKVPGEIKVVSIDVVRVGDKTERSIVRVHTRDGTAKANKDYIAFSKEVIFEKNEALKTVKVRVLYDGEPEIREAFSLHIRPGRNSQAEVKKRNKAVVYIEEMERLSGVTFPTEPIVVSLRDYDDVIDPGVNPVAGYPLICITACDSRHPAFIRTESLCEREGINNTLTRYRWRVGAPPTEGGVTPRLTDLEDTTFMTSTKMITLDSIYFSPGTRIQCVSRAVNTDGDVGLELFSEPVSISSEGLCPPRLSGSVGAEPFLAKLRYTGVDDPDYPNMVRLTVIVPHRDGLLPAISTQQLSNFDLALSPDAFRLGLHKCSNLIDYFEKETTESFLTEETRNKHVTGEIEANQYSEELRGGNNLRFYRNLDLESCMWEFVSYYNMTELVTTCGGEIATDGKVRDLIQSFVSVRIPLYVSYVYHSPISRSGWQNFDLKTSLQLTFVYDTAQLWQQGIGAPEGAQLQGRVYPSSMRIRKDGRLVVQFRSQADFRGLFVPLYSGTGFTSTVTTPNHPDVKFKLKLIRSDPNFAKPEQLWEFESEYAIRDYSGDYKINLIPCTTSPDQQYSVPVRCNPHDPLTFDLQIRFQQVSDAVPEEFSLSMKFHVLRKRALWLSDGSMGFGEESDVAFNTDDRVYGRINVESVQDLGESFDLHIEKVFICAGKDGYVPKYDPENNEFGCISHSDSLLHTFRLLDKGAPNTIDSSFEDVPFDARLAVDDPDARDLVDQPGADGFSLNAKPLFQVESGRQWFLHIIYSVRSADSHHTKSVVAKRSIHSALGVFQYGSRTKRAVPSVPELGGQSGKGTNMIRIALDYNSLDNNNDSNNYDASILGSKASFIGLIAGLSILVVLVATLTVVVILRKRSRKTPSRSSAAIKNGSLTGIHGTYTYGGYRTTRVIASNKWVNTGVNGNLSEV